MPIDSFIREVEKPICLLCHQRFNPITDRGTLECRFHPQIRNDVCDGELFKRYHFECCGATDIKTDLKHFERSRPHGCLAIDHVETRQKLREFIRVPYFVVIQDEANVVRGLEKRFSKNVIKISSTEQLDTEISFPIYKDDLVHINPRDLKVETVDPDRLEISSNRSYKKSFDTSSYYTYDDSANHAVEETKFKPFYIMRRCAFKQDERKLYEYCYGDPPCGYKV